MKRRVTKPTLTNRRKRRCPAVWKRWQRLRFTTAGPAGRQAYVSTYQQPVRQFERRPASRCGAARYIVAIANCSSSRRRLWGAQSPLQSIRRPAGRQSTLRARRTKRRDLLTQFTQYASAPAGPTCASLATSV